MGVYPEWTLEILLNPKKGHASPAGPARESASQPSTTIRQIRLAPGSRFAARFPHLTKGAAPTKGGDTEMEI